MQSNARYGVVRACWADHPDIGADEIAVMTALSWFADADGVCWPSQTTLAAKLKRSRSWVCAMIGRLVAAGLLEKTDRWHASGGRRSCLYRIVGHQPAGLPSPAPVAPAAAPVATMDRGCQPTDTEQPNPESRDSLPDRAQPGGGKAGAMGADDGPATIPPAGWVPDAADLAWAERAAPGIDPLRFAELFTATCQARGYRYRDHGAAFRAWLLNPRGDLRHVRRPPSRPVPPEHATRTAAAPGQRSHPAVRPGPAALRTGNDAVAAQVLARLAGRGSGPAAAGPAG